MTRRHNPKTTSALSHLRESGRRISICLGLAGALLVPSLSEAHPSPSHTLDEINEHLEESPNDQAQLRSKAHILIVMGKFEDAHEIVHQLIHADPKNPENLLLDARITVLLEKNINGAITEAESLTKSAPDFGPGWDFLADLLYQTGRKDKAIAAKKKYLEVSESKNPSDYLTCAAWLRDRGKAGDAQAAIEVLDQGTARIGVLTGLEQAAIALDLSLKQWNSALRRIDLLTARLRPNVDLASQRADILMQAGRFAEAAAAYDSAIAILKASPSWKRDPDGLEQRLAKLLEQKQTAQTKSSQASIR